MNIDVDKIKNRLIQSRLKKLKQIQVSNGYDSNRKKVNKILLDPADNIFYNTPKGDGMFYNH